MEEREKERDESISSHEMSSVRLQRREKVGNVSAKFRSSIAFDFDALAAVRKRSRNRSYVVSVAFTGRETLSIRDYAY